MHHNKIRTITQYKRSYDVISICTSSETGSFSFWEKLKSPPVFVRRWTARSQLCVEFSGRSSVVSKKQTEWRSCQELQLFTDHILQATLLPRQTSWTSAVSNYSPTQFLQQRDTLSQIFLFHFPCYFATCRRPAMFCETELFRSYCDDKWVAHKQPTPPGYGLRTSAEVAGSRRWHWLDKPSASKPLGRTP